MLIDKADTYYVEQTLALFNQSADFAYSLGVPLNNLRLASYREFLRALANGEDDRFVGEDAVRLWREVQEILFVFTTLRAMNSDLPAALLKRCLDGGPLDKYDDEHGRNHFLELRAAAYLQRMGYSVDLSEDADVVAVRGGSRVYVECKRIYSEKKAQHRTRECIKQLAKRLDSARGRYRNFGLAWIDPSAAMQKRFLGYIAYSTEGVRQAARSDLASFYREFMRGALLGANKRIFGVNLQMVSPGWVANSSTVTTMITTCMLPCARGLRNYWAAMRFEHDFNFMLKTIDPPALAPTLAGQCQE